MTTTTTHPTGQRLPLHAFHVSHLGRMVQFAGYEMPIHYAAGILQEHLHTRAAATLFDVSHMGQILTGEDGFEISVSVEAVTFVAEQLVSIRRSGWPALAPATVCVWRQACVCTEMT